MTVNCPDESEIRDLFIAQFDELDQTRTEDRHPVPEFWAWLHHEGYPIFGLDSLAFAEEMFDLWERANATEANVLRWVSDAETRPSVITNVVDRVRADALADFEYMVRKHVGQPTPVQLREAS